VRLRPAVAGDAASLAALARRVFAATYGAAIPAPTLHAYLHERVTAEVFGAQIAADALLVAEADAGPAGYLRLHAGPLPACVGGPAVVELAQLYVDLAYQARGLGARLLAAASAAVANDTSCGTRKV
jgi:GNAT superfamily N-acetyltransferase